MYTRKLTAILLFAAMLATLSCGEAAPVQTDTSAADTDTTTAAETGEYTVPDVDYGGAEFVILEQDTNQYNNWICQKYYSIVAEEENGDPINDAMYRTVRQTEEELNVDITYQISQKRLEEMRKMVLAQDDEYDLITHNNAGTISAEEGLAVDFGSIDTIDLSASWWQQNAVESFTLNGQVKALIGDITPQTYFAPIMFFFNKAVAEEFKLGNLYDLVRSGDWTLAKAYEMSRTVAADLNGDNKMDENDRYGTALQDTLVTDLLIGGGGRFAVQNNDGGIDLVLNNERNASIIADAVTFIRDDNVNCRAQLYTNKSWKNVFAHLHIPMFKNNQLLFNFNQLLITFELRSMDADFGVIPMPKYDKEQAEYFTPISLSWAEFISIPTTNQELDMAGHVLDSLGYYGQQYVTPAFIDITVKDKSLRDEDSVEMLELIMGNVVYDLGVVYDWGSLRSGVNGLGGSNKPNGFASMYASKEKSALAGIEQTLELLAEE
ncbi:MAG: hypothetical protein E7632_02630 [Ruminococcaceae bacterium]|nr:hypothetical protein [Oscillospiraceae bacterium]